MGARCQLEGCGILEGVLAKLVPVIVSDAPSLPDTEFPVLSEDEVNVIRVVKSMVAELLPSARNTLSYAACCRVRCRFRRDSHAIRLHALIELAVLVVPGLFGALANVGGFTE